MLLKKIIVKIQKDSRPRVTLEFGTRFWGPGGGGGGDNNSVLSQVTKLICSLLVWDHLKLFLSREGDRVLAAERRRCSELRSHF